MKTSVPLLVFSDLDGTLLDHSDYSWSAARPALSRLAALGAPVILASSKTAVEIDALQAQMGLSGFPAIVENGAGVTGMQDADAPPQYDALRAALDAVAPALRAQFEGFGDMDAGRVAEATGLPAQDAIAARSRAFSEPGLWHGTPQGEAAFVAALAPAGVAARRGGRFLTLSFGKTKADRMAQIIARYRPAHTIALGDAPNDIEMLEAADFGVIIANPHHAPLPPLPRERTGQITRTAQAGPAGWNAAMIALTDQFNLLAEQT